MHVRDDHPASATLADLVAAAGAGPVVAYGLSPPAAAYAAARLLDGAPAARLVVIVPDENRAQDLTRDLRLFVPPVAAADGDPTAPARADSIPAPGTSPYAEVTPDRGALMRRMTALYRLARGGAVAPRAVVVSAASLVRRVIPPAELLALSFQLERGQVVGRD